MAQPNSAALAQFIRRLRRHKARAFPWLTAPAPSETHSNRPQRSWVVPWFAGVLEGRRLGQTIGAHDDTACSARARRVLPAGRGSLSSNERTVVGQATSEFKPWNSETTKPTKTQSRWKPQMSRNMAALASQTCCPGGWTHQVGVANDVPDRQAVICAKTRDI